MSEDEPYRIVHITLDERTVIRRSADIEHERRVAIFDLLEENFFRPTGIADGPYRLRLGMVENRLMMDIRDGEDQELGVIELSLVPFKKRIKEYFMICESYYQAIRSATPSQIEAIDMGRRGVHNEASEFLQSRLEERVEVDMDTARRLFTLICVLQIRS